MIYQDWLRLTVLVCTALFAVSAVAVIWVWHRKPSTFDLRDLFMTVGKDKKPHVNRVALAELVSLWATTSAYLGVMSSKPEMFVEATAIYGGIWAVRGGYATWVKNK